MYIASTKDGVDVRAKEQEVHDYVDNLDRK